MISQPQLISRTSLQLAAGVIRARLIEAPREVRVAVSELLPESSGEIGRRAAGLVTAVAALLMFGVQSLLEGGHG